MQTEKSWVGNFGDIEITEMKPKINTQNMRKPEVVVKKKSLRGHEEETCRGTRYEQHSFVNRSV